MTAIPARGTLFGWRLRSSGSRCQKIALLPLAPIPLRTGSVSWSGPSHYETSSIVLPASDGSPPSNKDGSFTEETDGPA